MKNISYFLRNRLGFLVIDDIIIAVIGWILLILLFGFLFNDAPSEKSLREQYGYGDNYDETFSPIEPLAVTYYDTDEDLIKELANEQLLDASVLKEIVVASTITESGLRKDTVISNINSTIDALNKGANINYQDKKNGNTALMYASLKGYEDMVKFLLDKGANVNIQNNVGDTALSFAVLKGYEDIVKLLLDSGVNVNIQNNDGDTVLLFAVDNGQLPIVKILLEYSANPNIVNKTGLSAISIAKNQKRKDMIRLLKAYGAK